MMIKFDNTFYDLESDIKSFLEEQHTQVQVPYTVNIDCNGETSVTTNDSASMYRWSINTQLLDNRFSSLIEKSPEMMHIALTGINYDKRSVLDLGCGFCQYWPFLEAYGFNEFVGIDLYKLRGYGDQLCFETASELVVKFCKTSKVDIYEIDVRQIDGIIKKDRKFDLIFTKSTNNTKLGSTGIPRDLFDKVVRDRLSKGGIAIYNG